MVVLTMMQVEVAAEVIDVNEVVADTQVHQVGDEEADKVVEEMAQDFSML